jgi:hypothetical protein
MFLTLNYLRKGDLGVFFEELDVELLKPAQHVNDHGLRRQDCGPASAKGISLIQNSFIFFVVLQVRKV